MASPRSVQFKGVPDVVQAYESQGIARFALFHGSQLLLKNDDDDILTGRELLSAYLNKIKRSAGIYTLCVYDDLSKDAKIKSNTPFDGSFNFQCMDYEDGGSPYSQLKEEFREMKEAVTGLIESRSEEKEDDGEPSKMGGVMGMIGKILENPTVQQAIAAKVIGFIDKIFLGGVAPQLQEGPAAMGAAPNGDSGGDQIQKIGQAVDFLFSVDPLLGDHLLQVADIARKSPDKYRSVISMLKTFS